METKETQINYIKDILDNKLPLIKTMEIIDDIYICKQYDYELSRIHNASILTWLLNHELITVKFDNGYEPSDITDKFDETYLIIKKQLEEYDECVA